ncbi:MAG: hypothetical protein EB059_06805 [Alphaproteobacteria bacterium]|nr:hypothetical protein [Alphaproteobacteria bacterium]
MSSVLVQAPQSEYAQLAASIREELDSNPPFRRVHQLVDLLGNLLGENMDGTKLRTIPNHLLRQDEWRLLAPLYVEVCEATENSKRITHFLQSVVQPGGIYASSPGPILCYIKAHEERGNYEHVASFLSPLVRSGIFKNSAIPIIKYVNALFHSGKIDKAVRFLYRKMKHSRVIANDHAIIKTCARILSDIGNLIGDIGDLIGDIGDLKSTAEYLEIEMGRHERLRKDRAAQMLYADLLIKTGRSKDSISFLDRLIDPHHPEDPEVVDPAFITTYARAMRASGKSLEEVTYFLGKKRTQNGLSHNESIAALLCDLYLEVNSFTHAMDVMNTFKSPRHEDNVVIQFALAKMAFMEKDPEEATKRIIFAWHAASKFGHKLACLTVMEVLGVDKTNTQAFISTIQQPYRNIAAERACQWRKHPAKIALAA